MNKKVLVIDNYDSFTYNLVHYMEDLDYEVSVVRNDEFSMDFVEKFDKILISPGPGIPNEAGQTKELIKRFYSTKSIMGVCLGHQAIGEVFGGKLKNLDSVFHGVATDIKIVSEDKVFKNIPKKIKVGRYHSWVVEKLNDNLEVLASDNDGNIMALRHKDYKVWGVQFHPESILTEYGMDILKNWLEL